VERVSSDTIEEGSTGAQRGEAKDVRARGRDEIATYNDLNAIERASPELHGA
jgi:hypothetical protein